MSKSGPAERLATCATLFRAMHLRIRDPKARERRLLPARNRITELQQAYRRESPPPTDSTPACPRLPNYLLPRFGHGRRRPRPRGTHYMKGKGSELASAFPLYCSPFGQLDAGQDWLDERRRAFPT